MKQRDSRGQLLRQLRGLQWDHDPLRAFVSLRGRAPRAVAVGLMLIALHPARLHAGDAHQLSQRELLEILRSAPPAPDPAAPHVRSFGSVDRPQDGTAVGYDPTTGREVAAEPAGSASSGRVDVGGEAEIGARSAPAQAGVLPQSVGDAAEPNLLPSAGENTRGDAPGPSDSLLVDTAAALPSPVYNTLGPPWRSIVKLLMRFNTAGTDYYYVCSASVIGSFHLLTAGHCIFNWDPNDDGDASDARWADEVWAWAAQTDQLGPVGVPEWPFGEAKAVYLRSYTGWTSSQDRAWDWGVIVLNRRDGDHTGWMGRETNNPTTALNFSGYAVETPYVPPGSLIQYHGFDDGNVLAYTDSRIQLAAYTFGGHSGGPFWRYDLTDNWIQGVSSTSDRMGYAEATLLTNEKYDGLDAWISEDESVRPPVALPDLTEYVFDPNARALLTSEARTGDTIDVTFNALNSGFAASGVVTVDFYLSPVPAMSFDSIYVGSRTLSSLDAYQYTVESAFLTVPPGVPPGIYYVGWSMSTWEVEYALDNNTAFIAPQTLAVLPSVAPGCAGDCGNDGMVDVSEVVRLVDVALGLKPLGNCTNGDRDGSGTVSIGEVIQAVGSLLNGC